jgi:hypothetical protein
LLSGLKNLANSIEMFGYYEIEKIAMANDKTKEDT